ncbi:MAG TPA: DNA-processing protein DprA [Gemmatimonadaceae bacterium]|nr:DNA-processing protein DprA [Gemmatimonadaceae bacterium]
MPTPPFSDPLLFGLALSAAQGVGLRAYYSKRAQFGTTEAAFLQTVPPEEQPGLLAGARATLTDAHARGVTVIGDEDDAYPSALRNLRDAPPHLFTLGDVSLFQRPAVAIVGTRAATQYGLRTTRALAMELARVGAAVVSGLARGIDAAAHEAALEVRGATIAVMGTGVDVPYPKLNKGLHARIAQQGLVVSEHPCGMQAYQGSFPRRNRIIAGLARAVIVSEAPTRSGALITAGIALDIGRDVGVVPGNIDSASSAGSNRLLRDGATPILEAGDALSLGGLQASAPAQPRTPEGLSDDAQLLWRALSASGPLSADALARAGGLEVRRAAPALAALELAGWVEVDHAGVIFPR